MVGALEDFGVNHVGADVNDAQHESKTLLLLFQNKSPIQR